MAKKNHKKTTNSSHGVRPSVGIILTLSVALIISIVISVVSVSQLKANDSNLASDKLAIFDHLAESYIRDMEFMVGDQPAYTQMTGYGVSDEDGVFYITFDFAMQPTDETPRHGIIYFKWDAEHGSYGHAYSYHDDAYHPGGIYYSLGN
ncbi:hypothetical protein IJG93_02600 [Candidatus Saccharibacteria bacterium]|nr:hypothetical protein [Candidatus Saccharibacteria bacterium]